MGMLLSDVRLATLIFRQDAPIPILAEPPAAALYRASGLVLWTQGGHHKAKWTVLPAGTRDLLCY